MFKQLLVAGAFAYGGYAYAKKAWPFGGPFPLFQKSTAPAKPATPIVTVTQHINTALAAAALKLKLAKIPFISIVGAKSGQAAITVTVAAPYVARAEKLLPDKLGAVVVNLQQG